MGVTEAVSLGSPAALQAERKHRLAADKLKKLAKAEVIKAKERMKKYGGAVTSAKVSGRVDGRTAPINSQFTATFLRRDGGGVRVNGSAATFTVDASWTVSIVSGGTAYRPGDVLGAHEHVDMLIVVSEVDGKRPSQPLSRSEASLAKVKLQAVQNASQFRLVVNDVADKTGLDLTLQTVQLDSGDGKGTMYISKRAYRMAQKEWLRGGIADTICDVNRGLLVAANCSVMFEGAYHLFHRDDITIVEVKVRLQTTTKCKPRHDACYCCKPTHRSSLLTSCASLARGLAGSHQQSDRWGLVGFGHTVLRQ